MGSLHLGWAASLLRVELASTGVFTLTHADSLMVALGGAVVFCAWPALCVAVLPFVRTPG